MEFKIDTKDTFTTIMPPETEISAKLTDELQLQMEQLTQSGRRNFIVDLNNCAEIDGTAIPGLIALHEAIYGTEQSLVFTGLNEKVVKTLKKDETDLLLNIAPSMIEAIDIISMEILERDLLGDE